MCCMDEKPYWDCQIEIISETGGYSFRCWYQQLSESMTDYRVYSSIAAAQVAAHSFAGWETVRDAIRHCYSSYRLGSLSQEEYVTLEHLILSVLNLEEV